MQVRTLRQNENATVSEWVTELLEFFDAVVRFHEYQLPLLQNAIDKLNNHIDKETGKPFETSSGGRAL